MTVGPDLIKKGNYNDAFVTKIRSDGTALDYSGYIGDSGFTFDASIDVGYDIAVDSSGAAFVTGYTSGSGLIAFPLFGGPDLTYNSGTYDAFITKVMADGTGFIYSGYIGSAGNDVGTGIAVDAFGNAYVTGYTTSDETTFPETGGPDLTYNGGYNDAFIAKVVAAGSGLVYAAYVGGSGEEGDRVSRSTC